MNEGTPTVTWWSQTLLALLLVPGAFGVGCDDAGRTDGVGGIEVVTAALGTCGANENRDQSFPTGADKVVVRVSGSAIPQPLTESFADTSAAQVVFPDVPVGTDVVVEVVACAGTTPVWEGRTSAVTVIEHAKSFPKVFLTPVGKAACIGTRVTPDAEKKLSAPRGFATLAPTPQGALVVGGVSTYNPATFEATATKNVDVYSQADSSFVKQGELAQPRAMALAVPQADGKVRVFGGSGAIRVTGGPDPPPPLWAPLGPGSPTCAVELYDPATGTSSCEDSVALAQAPALALATGGAVVAAGGIKADGSTHGTASEAGAVLMAGVAPKAFTMPQGRFGATAVGLESGHVLVWGGNFDGDVAKVALLVDPATAVVTELGATTLSAVPFFASSVSLGPDGGSHRVLIAGGSNIASVGGQVSFSLSVEQPRLELVSVDVAAGTAVARVVDMGSQPVLFQRAAASLSPVGDGSFWLYGGFTSFSKNATICGGSADTCLQAATLRFRLDSLGASPKVVDAGGAVDLTLGPFATSAGPLADGSWLVVGGIGEKINAPDAVTSQAALVRFTAAAAALCQ